MAVAPVSVAHVEPSAKRQSGPAGLVGQTARRPRRALFYRILPVLFVARRNLARQRRWACNSRWRFFDAYSRTPAAIVKPKKCGSNWGEPPTAYRSKCAIGGSVSIRQMSDLAITACREFASGHKSSAAAPSSTPHQAREPQSVWICPCCRSLRMERQKPSNDKGLMKDHSRPRGSNASKIAASSAKPAPLPNATRGPNTL